ncbi:hypothetical protein KVR01_011380 [Diaporthe batatas]|uniref:uncharacterized protein n=1 Tax=Diaporthe batatas TaxID=748121 RepID=UPI001D043116|nr:uncharacterized protein KVR01_011380 [Diaporthe batatas]KAG8158937.1 hypothetical protein KVR01_011380 [Diaporthe batatas]
MAKQKSKAPSIHSRAARRATSPSINTDKSLKDARPPPESADARPSVLGLHQAAGVSKKTKRGRKAVLSTRARKRHERGLERAEEIVDRTSNKVLKSKKSAAKIAGRSRGWDEINAQAGAAGARVGALGSNKFAGLADGGDDGDEDEDVEELDDEMWEADKGGPVVAHPPPKSMAGSRHAPPAPPAPEDGDEEIL